MSVIRAPSASPVCNGEQRAVPGLAETRCTKEREFSPTWCMEVWAESDTRVHGGVGSVRHGACMEVQHVYKRAYTTQNRCMEAGAQADRVGVRWGLRQIDRLGASMKV
jgi:hypothetical protein